ncbi:MAG: hypothetical protein JNK09_19710 [Prolixibacteraceae bacterium]|nr:hypothetical protein [Prolixibacteraceae bacterium]
MTEARVFYFNPTCELAVANGSFSYMPPLLLQEMETDLSILPLVFAGANDFILSPTIPSSEFISQLKDVGFELPNFRTLPELESLPDRSIHSLFPWGWSPAAHFILKNLKQKCSDEFKLSPVFEWNDFSRKLFERKTALSFLSGLLKKEHLEWFVSNDQIGRVITNCEQVEEFLPHQNGVVLKAPLSSSGRGIQIIRKQTLNASNRQWISGVLKQQLYLIVEPFLDKVADLSFQFFIRYQSEVDYLGYSFFETNSNGQYKGTLINPDLQDIFPDIETSGIEKMLQSTAQILTRALKSSNYFSNYDGYLGVDALIFRENNEIKIQPCLEINCRMNMGILALLLARKVHPDSKGKFMLFYGAPGEYLNLVNEQNNCYPLKVVENKLMQGFLSLTEPGNKTKFGAYISLGEAR